jgi:RNA polymerase sigma-70 factor (ECF subfamily)
MGRTLNDALTTKAAKSGGAKVRHPNVTVAASVLPAEGHPILIAAGSAKKASTAAAADSPIVMPTTDVLPGGAVAAPTQPTDEQLLEAYRQGDKSSFAALVARYQRELYHFLTRFLGDRIAAEDVFQETFLQVHQSRNQFDPARRFKPWLFTIAANKARDLMRSRARRPTNPLQASVSGGQDEGTEFMDLMAASGPAGQSPEEPLEQQEMKDAVQRIVQSMPDHLREILLLSYFHQFPYKQIGDILGIPLGTVKSRLHAAVAYFAERWKAAN